MSTMGAPLGPDDIHDPIPTNGTTTPKGPDFKTGAKVEGVQRPIGTKGRWAIAGIAFIILLAILDGMNIIHIDLGLQHLIPGPNDKPQATSSAAPAAYTAGGTGSSLELMLTDNSNPKPSPNPNAKRQTSTQPKMNRPASTDGFYTNPGFAAGAAAATTPNLDASGPRSSYNPNFRYPSAVAPTTPPTPSAASIKAAQDAVSAESARNADMSPGSSQNGNQSSGLGNGQNQPPVVAENPMERPGGPSQSLQQLSASRFGHPVAEGYLMDNREPAVSRYEIWPGRKLELQFDDAIIVDNPGAVCAHLTKPIKDSMTATVVLMPEQTILCGVYNNVIGTGASRIQIAFREATFPDGSTLALDGMAAGDRNGWSGLSADVNNHLGAVIGSALLTSIVAGVAAATNPSPTSSLIGLQTQQTPGQAIGQSILNTGQQITNQKIALPPTLSLAKGTVANLNVDRAIVLPPYHPMPSMDEDQ
jgi:type IV secretory pathway VirB10-like protein